MKRGLLLIFALMLVVNLSQNISAVISCGNQTYPDGTGYCCDTNNGANGVWFRGDYYSQCPSGQFRYVNKVNPSCSDAGAGTFSQPWCTMAKANTAASGNVVIFLGGTYNEVPTKPCNWGGGATLHPENSGTLGIPTIFKGHPDYPRTIVMGYHTGPTYARLAGYDNDYWHQAACLSSYQTVDHMEFTKSACGGVFFFADWVTVQDSVIHDNLGTGGENCAHIGIYYNPSNNIVIRGNEIYGPIMETDGGGVCLAANCAGINIYRTKNVTIEDNYIHDVGTFAIFFKQMVSNSIIRRNKFTRNGVDIAIWCPVLYDGWGDYGPPPRYTGDNDVYENVIYNSSGNFPNGWKYYGPDIQLRDMEDRCDSHLRNVRVFNNILANTPSETGIDFNSGPGNQNLNSTLYNNMIINYGLSGGENLLLESPNDILDLKSGYNIYYDDFETGVIQYGTSNYDLNTLRTIRPDLEINSKQLNPQFLSTNPSSPDFLRPNPLTSPAIDGGVKVPGYHCNVSASIDPNQVGCKLWYGSAPDMGAYEYNPGIPIVTCQQADVNDDLIINIIDLALVIYNQGQSLTGRDHLNVNSQDSVINYQDVSEVRNRLGMSC